LKSSLKESTGRSVRIKEPDLYLDQSVKQFFVLIIILFSGLFTEIIFADPLYMWHVSRGDTQMYLLGSIHVLSEKFYPLPEFIDEVSSRADILVLEADPSRDNLNTQGMKQLLQEHGYFHDGSRIGDILTVDLYRSLGTVLKTFGLCPDQVSLMKPWLLALTLQNLEFESSGIRAELGMEQVLLRSHGNREVMALEGLEYQLELLSGLSAADQLELLTSTLGEAGSMEAELDLLVQAWQRGEPDLIASILEIEGLSRSISERLLVQRNISMARQAADLFTSLSGKHTILFVVGAAHFCGEKGIPSLLSAEGFNVAQVDDSGDLLPFSAVVE